MSLPQTHEEESFHNSCFFTFPRSDTHTKCMKKIVKVISEIFVMEINGFIMLNALALGSKVSKLAI